MRMWMLALWWCNGVILHPVHFAVMSSHCTAQACKSRCLLDVDAWSHLERAAALKTWMADTTARGVCVEMSLWYSLNSLIALCGWYSPLGNTIIIILFTAFCLSLLPRPEALLPLPPTTMGHQEEWCKSWNNKLFKPTEAVAWMCRLHYLRHRPSTHSRVEYLDLWPAVIELAMYKEGIYLWYKPLALGEVLNNIHNYSKWPLQSRSRLQSHDCAGWCSVSACVHIGSCKAVPSHVH